MAWPKRRPFQHNAWYPFKLTWHVDVVYVMQVKPLLLTIAILGGLAYLADQWMLDRPARLHTVNQHIIAFPLPVASPDTAVIRPDPPSELVLQDPDKSELEQGIQGLITKAKIKKRLFKVGLLEAGKIQILVSKDQIIIKGQIASEEARLRILDQARRAAGNFSVSDQMEAK